MENTVEAKASLKNFRGSPRKARLILDMIRGKNVTLARNILKFSTKKMAKDIHKLLNSAVSNVTQIGGKMSEESMVISTAYADGGMVHKRRMPRANGNATMILKRTCHINIHVTGNKG